MGNSCSRFKKSKSMTRKGNSARLIDMPILVVEKLLEYLSPSAILALRLTCTDTKGWIDRDDYILRDFELRIEAEPKDAYICRPSITPWSNFAIPYVQLHSTFIQETIYNYCDLIWRLEIYPPKPNAGNSTIPYSLTDNHSLFDIINHCSELEHLEICQLETMTNLGMKGEYEKLRVLSIDSLQCMTNADFTMFESLIMKCPHLEYIKIPLYEIVGSLAVNFDVNAWPEREYLVRSLIRYLDTYRNCQSETGVISRGKKLYIDVLEFKDFELWSSEILYELSRKCVECNAVLMNVPGDAVNRNQQDIVESFASISDLIDIDFRASELLKNLEVTEFWIDDHPDVELIMRQLSFLKTISRIETLRSLSLTIRLSIDDPDNCSPTLAACVGANYPGIQKLNLCRPQASTETETYVRIPLGFGNAFSNLKYISFHELDSRNEDFKGLWGSLPNLEELFMYKCPYLTQDAFIISGDAEGNKSVILQLTKLQVLIISIKDGAAGFNDEFLIRALRYTRLRGFALLGDAGVDLEFTERGMLSLLESPFHDTVEDFLVPPMYFRVSSSQYLKIYQKLCRKRIRLCSSVVVNSLRSNQHLYDFQRKCLRI